VIEIYVAEVHMISLLLHRGPRNLYDGANQ
jgi:hypothetical protein